MTKREFLKELEDRLQMLDEKERKDMIEEYSQHISMCMKSGMKEEEAIEDFGDMDDLIAEILEAYHLDPEYEVKSRERSGKTGIADLLPKDFFKKKTKIAKAGNKSNVNDENDKSNARKNRRVEGTKRFKEEQGRKIENITSKAVKTSSNAVSWSWDKIKKFFFIFIKIVLVFLALPAVFFDLAGLFGLGILGVMAFQGYPVIGCVIIAFGAVLSMTAYILFLFTHKVEYLSIFEIALQMVVDLHRTASCRTTRIEQVSCLERKILADVGDDFIHLVEHIARTAFLHILAVDVEMEVDSLDVTELLDIHPFADGGRTVESLGKFPWLTRLSQLLLHLAGGKVDAHGHRIIIAVGETLRNGLAQLADAHHQFGLILYSSQMVWNEERLAVVEQRRISLGKNNRTLWFR